MSKQTLEHCLVERRDDLRRQHFDRRDKARFSPGHSDRRSINDRRQIDNIDPSPTPHNKT